MSGPLKPIPLGTTAIAYETLARGLAEALRGTLPGHLGFTLFIFDQGPQPEGKESVFTYVSTANREDMLATLREFLAKAAP